MLGFSLEEDVGRESFDRGHRYANEDADPSNGLCFSGLGSLRCFRLQIDCCPHKKGEILFIVRWMCSFWSFKICFDVLVVRVEVIVCWQEFDKKYGSGWQCVVGSNFGCFFTHTKGSFIYFTLETLNFLIFKGATSPWERERERRDLEIVEREGAVEQMSHLWDGMLET